MIIISFNILNRLELFEKNDAELIKTEVVLYTWRDATLKEIVE